MAEHCCALALVECIERSVIDGLNYQGYHRVGEAGYSCCCFTCDPEVER